VVTISIIAARSKPLRQPGEADPPAFGALTYVAILFHIFPHLPAARDNRMTSSAETYPEIHLAVIAAQSIRRIYQ
jgi:hypothetical protein